jgi:translation elongation factor EF-1alpha
MPEERVGVVTHYFGHIKVAAVLLDGPLKVGDTIHIKGHTSDFVEQIDSMQVEHASVEAGEKGQEIAINVTEHARQHDEVFKVTD